MRSALFIFLSLALFAQNSPQVQAALDQSIVQEARRSTTPVERKEVQNYVQELGKRLDASGVAGAFSVVRVKDYNALHEPYVLPDGSIFVPVDLLLAANDEPEFAGMISQSIARGFFRFKSTAGKIPMSFIYGSNMMPADARDQWREKELQADATAVGMMSRAGFDPSALLRYIERVQPRDRPDSPFPPRAERIAALQKAVADLPPAVYSESDEFYTIQGFVRPPAAPSSTPPDPNERPTLKRKPVPDN